MPPQRRAFTSAKRRRQSGTSPYGCSTSFMDAASRESSAVRWGCACPACADSGKDNHAIAHSKNGLRRFGVDYFNLQSSQITLYLRQRQGPCNERFRNDAQTPTKKQAMTIKEITRLYSEWIRETVVYRPPLPRDDWVEHIREERRETIDRPEFGFSMGLRMAGRCRLSPLVNRPEYKWVRKLIEFYEAPVPLRRSTPEMSAIHEALDIYKGSATRLLLHSAWHCLEFVFGGATDRFMPVTGFVFATKSRLLRFRSNEYGLIG